MPTKTTSEDLQMYMGDVSGNFSQARLVNHLLGPFFLVYEFVCILLHVMFFLRSTHTHVLSAGCKQERLLRIPLHYIRLR